MVLKRDPDCVILAYMSGSVPAWERLRGRFGWDRLRAVTTHRVYGDIDPDLILRPGPRLMEGLREIQRRLYP